MVSKKGYVLMSIVGVAAIAAIAIAFGVSQASSLAVQRAPAVASVTIPQGSSMMVDGQKETFVPQVITVVVGVNNTVRWTNQDSVTAFIEADNDRMDPAFFKATTLPESVVTSADGQMTSATSDIGNLQLPNVLQPGESFEYTFTIPGEYGYHGKPWQRGTVIVLPAEAAK